jgi:hypothetical protein
MESREWEIGEWEHGLVIPAKALFNSRMTGQAGIQLLR